ncbi:MAG: cell division protein ZapA [Bacteroidales bacterium]|nr:cell division protein ZapA [Bacteroidales bacterium]
MAQSISVVIADRSYPLQVKSPEHEEMIRKAVDDINRRVKFYLDKYPTKGMIEVLSLVALNVGIVNSGLQKQLENALEEEGALLKELEAYLDNIE